MGHLTETEILAKHAQSLREAADQCRELARQQDPQLIAPRGWRYRRLRTAIEELEGSAVQMSYYRADGRWTALAAYYARTINFVQRQFSARNWAIFGKLAVVFAEGHRHQDELANKRTGATGVMLLANPSAHLTMPDWKAPRRPTVQ